MCFEVTNFVLELVNLFVGRMILLEVGKGMRCGRDLEFDMMGLLLDDGGWPSGSCSEV